MIEPKPSNTTKFTGIAARRRQRGRPVRRGGEVGCGATGGTAGGDRDDTLSSWIYGRSVTSSSILGNSNVPCDVKTWIVFLPGAFKRDGGITISIELLST